MVVMVSVSQFRNALVVGAVPRGRSGGVTSSPSHAPNSGAKMCGTNWYRYPLPSLPPPSRSRFVRRDIRPVHGCGPTNRARSPSHVAGDHIGGLRDRLTRKPEEPALI